MSVETRFSASVSQELSSIAIWAAVSSLGMGTRAKHHRQVAAAMRYVRECRDGWITLTDLADAAESSPFHFERVFRRMTTMAPGRYVRWVRLVRAAISLRSSDLSVVQIALAAGYANHESFSRAFRAEFGRPPREYRREHKSSDACSEGGTMKDLGVSVGLVKVPVTAFARATQFYREVLGLEEEFAVEQYGWAQYKTASVPLCLYVTGMGGGDGKPGGETGIQLRVRDAKAAHASIRQRGGNVSDLDSGDDGSVGFAVRDPDGNSISIIQIAE